MMNDYSNVSGLGHRSLLEETTVHDHNRRLYRAPRLSINHYGYPQQPKWHPECQLEEQFYKTLPEDPDNPAARWPRRREIAGPASVKHLYTGEPNYYPYQIRYVPEGTMYESDLTTRDIGPRRFSFHYKAYPLTHRYAREVNKYLQHPDGKIHMLPYPDIRRWSNPVVVHDYDSWGGWGSSAH